jgi:hypothetical protein
MRAGQPYEKEIAVSFPVESANNSVLANLWARARISDLMSKDWNGFQQQTVSPELEKEITQIGLKYGLMTQFTSFVAVEERVTNVNGKPTRVQVPVELPENVEFEAGWSNGLTMYEQMGMASKTDRFSMGQRVNTQSSAMAVHGSVGGALTTAKIPQATIGAGVAGGIGAVVGGGAGGNVPSLVKDEASQEVRAPGPPRSDAYRRLAEKARPEVMSIYECWEKQADKTAAAATCKLGNGKIGVEIVFSGTDTAQMVAVGFEPEGTQVAHGRLRGRIAVEKLPELAGLAQVRLIALRQ